MDSSHFEMHWKLKVLSLTVKVSVLNPVGDNMKNPPLIACSQYVVSTEPPALAVCQISTKVPQYYRHGQYFQIA